MTSFATALLVAGLALTGCRTGQAEEPTAPATRPPASTAAPIPRTTAPTVPTTATPSGPSRRDPVCAGALSWGTGPKQVVASPITAEIYQVRAATHEACDRVVFDLNGLGRVGYLARYVPAVRAGPSDRPIPVAGAAALQVTGVRSHRPFRVLVLADNGNHITHLVIDIAH